MESTLHTSWKQIATLIQHAVGAETFRRWFAAVRPLALDAQCLTLQAPNSISQLWIETNYLPQIATAVRQMLGGKRQILFSIDPKGQEWAGELAEEPAAPAVGHGASRSRADTAANSAAQLDFAKAALLAGDEPEEPLIETLPAPRDEQFDLFGHPIAEPAAPLPVAPAAPGVAKPPKPAAKLAEKSAEEKAPQHGMNPRNTFASFVVGENSKFAHAAAVAVANKPAQTYNPLFLYGGVGLGKTHLLHAIGQHILEANPAARVVYLSSEKFTNEYIDAIKNGRFVAFRNKYRKADVLLIDDIQFFANKGAIQEEFFHTFNTLSEGHKQIILSSDRPPSEIANLQARLVSRFEWGLTAELQPPAVETRLAILRKKAQQLQIKLKPVIYEFLAERIRSNIRRLEGALIRVGSFASLSGGELTIDQVEQVLKDILQEEGRKAITIDQIQRKVAERFDIRLADMTSKRRPANIAFPRQIAMYLARENTKASLSEIGEAFGGRDHGTVLHACKLVKTRMAEDEKVRLNVAALTNLLNR